MNIEIRRLTPDLAEDYIHFFDTTPHNGEEDGNQCYCITWRSDASYADNSPHWFPTAAERRERAAQFVREGSIQGYLAYLDHQVVGWCNANAECRGGLGYLRSYWPIEEDCAGVRIKSVFCFLIAPAMRRKGIAAKLLECVCQDAAAEGFDFVEAYVDRNSDAEETDFRGSVALYKKCGFYMQAERSGRVVVRKSLK